MSNQLESKHPLAIVVSGVSGSGKTTVGRRLAPALGATFLEGDDYHPASNIAKMRSGQPLSDADRWPWLEKLGHAMAAHMKNGRPIVTACSALRVAYRDALRQAAACPLTFIHLTVEPTALAARMRARRQHFMPVALLESQLALLEPLGPDEAGAEIRAAGSLEHTVESVLHWLRRGDHMDPGAEHDTRRPSHPFAGSRKTRPLRRSDD